MPVFSDRISTRMTLAALGAASVALCLLPALAAIAQDDPQPSPKPSPKVKAAPTDDDRDAKLDVKVTLNDGTDTIVTRSRRELGFQVSASGPITFKVDKAILKAALNRIGETTFRQDAADAKPYMYKGTFHLDPGNDARVLNVPTTAETIIADVTRDPTVRHFTVTLDKTAPTLPAEKLDGIDGVLATFQTITTSNENRNTNIAIAVEHIDKTLLAPGEVFSLNKIVGERTKANGFKTAHVFEDGKVVDGLGGGVSQVTGTLFNTAALAGLTIKEVNPHSRPVAYLPLGRDATVAWGAKDLRFANNTGAPLYIVYTFHDRHLRATLFGKTTPGQDISLRPRVQERGPGRIDAQLYRMIKQDGKVIRRERLVSHEYRWDANTPNP